MTDNTSTPYDSLSGYYSKEESRDELATVPTIESRKATSKLSRRLAQGYGFDASNSAANGRDADASSDAGVERARQAMRHKVARGVAIVAGAVEGFADTMRETRLADKAKEAIEQVGKTTRHVAQTAKSQALRVRDAVVNAVASNDDEPSAKAARDDERRRDRGFSESDGLAPGYSASRPPTI